MRVVSHAPSSHTIPPAAWTGAPLVSSVLDPHPVTRDDRKTTLRHRAGLFTALGFIFAISVSVLD
jgi:hypothetical protein